MIRKNKILRSGLYFCMSAMVLAYASLVHASAGELPAAAALVMDASSEKILYAKNPNLKLRPASTTKLITAMVVLDRLDPDTLVRISDHAAKTPSVSPRLRTGEQFSVRSLLALALMRSVNSAAVALAEAAAGSEYAFTELMNRKAVELGADNSRFINASGLPGPNQYVTAYDLARIMKAALQYPMIADLIYTRTLTVVSTSGRKLAVKNTNELLWDDSGMLGGKTGFTREARHCFVAASNRDGNTIISVVLGEPHRPDLWQDTSRLIARGDDVMHRRAEPVITYSSASESPVVFATYSHGSQKKGKAAAYSKKKKSGSESSSVKAKKTKKNVKKNPVKKTGKKITAGNSRSTGRS